MFACHVGCYSNFNQYSFAPGNDDPCELCWCIQSTKHKVVHSKLHTLVQFNNTWWSQKLKIENVKFELFRPEIFFQIGRPGVTWPNLWLSADHRKTDFTIIADSTLHFRSLLHPQTNAPTTPPASHCRLSWLVGDVLWGRISGHPWWPCMVAYDAATSTFMRERKRMMFILIMMFLCSVYLLAAMCKCKIPICSGLLN